LTKHRIWLDNFVVRPFAVLKNFFNPRNSLTIPAVKIFASLKNKQQALLSKRLKMADTIEAANDGFLIFVVRRRK